MHEFNLKIVKILLVVFTASIFLGMLGGINLLKNNYYWKANFFILQIDYIKEKAAFEIYYHDGLFGWISNSTKNDRQNTPTTGTAQSIPILLYHGVITDSNWKSDGTNISLVDFRSQLFAIKKAGYQTITLTQFLDFMQKDKPVPEKSVLITFDDSRSDSYYPTEPILRALNYNAVMFAITGRSIGTADRKSNFHLSEDELKKMLASGHWEIASHTQNGHGFVKIDASGTQGHFLSDKIWLDNENRLETDTEYTQRISTDLAASKKDLENNLHIKVLGFAYPFGDYGNDTQDFPQAKAIISKIVNSLFPLTFRQKDVSEFPGNYPGKDFRMVKRIDVNSDMPTDYLLFILNSSQKKSLPYSDSFSTNNGWLTGWGNFELKNGLLLTRASASEDSSMTFLNGTNGWTNYNATAQARLLQGDSFAAVARYIDRNNYVSCDFTENGAGISQMIHGKELAISEFNQDLKIPPTQNIRIGISVSGNSLTCYIEGKAIVSGIISPALNQGGIGFKTWDNTINNSSLLISNLRVNPIQ